MKKMKNAGISLYGSDEESLKRYNEIHSSLDHPLVIKYFDSFKDSKERCHIVTEHVDGGDLN